MENNTFVFMRSYYEAAQKMNPDQRHQLYDAIIEYAFTGAVPDELDNLVDIVFCMARPTIDAGIERYARACENGKKGGRPRKKKTKEETNAETNE